MHLLILSLVTVIAVSGQQIVDPENESRNSLCVDQLKRCMDRMQSFGPKHLPVVGTSFANMDDIINGQFYPIFNMTYYTQLCQANAAFQICYNRWKDRCDYQSTYFSSRARILAYICSNEGRRDYKNIADSSCIAKKEALDEAYIATRKCRYIHHSRNNQPRSDEESPLQETCRRKKPLIDCRVTAMTTHCGTAYGVLTEKYYYTRDGLSDCLQQATQTDIVTTKHRGCYSEIKTCLDQLKTFQPQNLPLVGWIFASGELATSHGEPIVNTTYYTQLCQANVDFKVCYNHWGDQCSYLLGLSSTRSRILEYICSVEGKQYYESIADSPCVTNINAEYASYLDQLDCTITHPFDLTIGFTQSHNDNECQRLSQLKSCKVNATITHCGDTYGTYAEKLINILYRHRSCEQQTTSPVLSAPDTS